MNNINFKENTFWALAFLLIPVIGSIFVDGWVWGLGDYVFAFVFFFVAGVIYQFFVKKVQSSKNKVWAILGLTILFMSIWAELAVGIFTNLGS